MITQDKQHKVILKKVSEMPERDLESVMAFIQSLEDKKSDIETHFASEQVLAKDWNKKEEEEAWQDL